jgi:hypothetical protein
MSGINSDIDVKLKKKKNNPKCFNQPVGWIKYAIA